MAGGRLGARGVSGSGAGREGLNLLGGRGTGVVHPLVAWCEGNDDRCRRPVELWTIVDTRKDYATREVADKGPRAGRGRGGCSVSALVPLEDIVLPRNMHIFSDIGLR